MSALTLRVHSPELGYLNTRDQPNGALVTTVPHGSMVTSLESDAATRTKVGQYDQWLQVKLPDGRAVYTAAWYLELVASASPPTGPSTRGEGGGLWVYSPEVGYLNIRNAPTTSGGLLTQAQHNDQVTALESEAEVQTKVGQRGQWLNIQLSTGQVGYAAASYLSPVSPPTPDSSLEPPDEDKVTVTANMSGTERKVAMVWNRLGGLMQQLAAQLGMDPGVAVAVWLVESGGRAFGADGRMTIRFENHLFDRYWGRQHPQRFAQHFTYSADQSWKGHQWRPSPSEGWRSFHNNQNTEWEVFTFASSLDTAAAQSSISMGGPQIMGFNYTALGYTSVGEMFKAFSESEGNQVIGFFNFIRNNRGGQTLQTLQGSDFYGFASHYNGSGQAEYYGNLIRQTYEAYHRIKAVSFAVSFAAEPGPIPMREVDDLERILGLGPKTLETLKAANITTFAQLAAMDPEQIEAALGDLADRLRWIETWPAQARLAAWGDWEALDEFQAQIQF